MADEHEENNHSFFAKLKNCKAPWGHNDDGVFIFWGLTWGEWAKVLLAFTIFYICVIALYIAFYFAALAVAGDSLYPIPGSDYTCTLEAPCSSVINPATQ
mmetsp:Transcript_5027/g.10649  ORF Transcript_5027/g.10649 Transcript_5027/m.10649 type:complete len:100 (+) Transcript_5027:89-388(+)